VRRRERNGNTEKGDEGMKEKEREREEGYVQKR
jgi:hypothetical protein